MCRIALWRLGFCFHTSNYPWIRIIHSYSDYSGPTCRWRNQGNKCDSHRSKPTVRIHSWDEELHRLLQCGSAIRVLQLRKQYWLSLALLQRSCAKWGWLCAHCITGVKLKLCLTFEAWCLPSGCKHHQPCAWNGMQRKVLSRVSSDTTLLPMHSQDKKLSEHSNPVFLPEPKEWPANLCALSDENISRLPKITTGWNLVCEGEKEDLSLVWGDSCLCALSI